MELVRPRCNIIRTGVSEDVVQGISCGDISGILANYHGKLGFIVCLAICRLVGDHQRCVRSSKACRWFKEERWMFRQLQLHLLCVLAIVETDAPDRSYF